MRVSLIDPSLFTLPYDQALAAGLTAEGHDVALFARRPLPDDGDPADLRLVEAFYRVAGSAPVRRLPDPMRLGIKGLDHLWSMARLVGRLRRLRPDVIHFQWLPLPLIDGRLLGRFRRIAPLVLTVHDTKPFNGNPSARLQASGFRDCLDRFDRLIIHTEQSHARLHAQGIPSGRMTIIPHGQPRGAGSDGAGDPMQGPITFVMFGKIKPYKGADLLLAAFALLPPDQRAQARVRIVGKPYMELGPLHDLVQANGLEAQVSIEPRFAPESEIAEIYAAGTVAVFPYRDIDASGMLYDAMQHGRPIIAARLGVFNEALQHGVHGLITPPEDVPALAACLARMIEDRRLAADCASAVRRLAKQAMSWDAVAERTATVYGEALSEARRRATDVRSSTRKTIGGNC